MSRKIDRKVAKAVRNDGQKLYVDYSAYETDEDDNPIDNLDAVAVEGKVLFVSRRSDWGGPKSRPYRSAVLDSPTWLTVAVCANAMIGRTRDHHHCFLEGVTKVGEEVINGDQVFLYTFDMGS